MKYDLRQLLRHADENGYAVPAFNFSDVWEMEAILEAAAEENSPVMIATNDQSAMAHTIPYLGAQGIHVMEHAPQPVILHLDHCFEIDKCKLAIDSGYASVMIDTSHLPLDENIAAAREVVKYAAAKKVAVEGEIGRIIGKSVEGTYEGDDFLVRVDDACRMAAETGIDSLAIGIGNAHGFYKSKPKLNFDRLKEINQATDIPLVLHGCTGLPEEDVQKAIKMGINKVNVGTQLHYTYITALRQELENRKDCINVIDLLTPVKAAIKKVVIQWIRICMSNGKA